MKKQNLVGRAFGMVTNSKKAIDTLVNSGGKIIRKEGEKTTVIKKEKNKKCFVLMVAKTFQKGHPKEGELTNFHNLIISDRKVHTIRANYDRWLEISEMVNSGEAYISVREWSGKPYNSKQTMLFILENISVQRLMINEYGAFINKNEIDFDALAKNDGLVLSDFLSWFNPHKNFGTYAIIHFTDFKY